MRMTFSIDEDVARLDIAMNHAVLVGVMDGARHRGHQSRHTFLHPRPLSLGPRFQRRSNLTPGELLGETLALDEPHADEGLSFRTANLKDRHDVWMFQSGGRLRFCLLYTSDAADERSSVDL